ncbi:MAG: MaoC family dehydratase [Nocardioidaceae bacterium]
MRVFTGRAELAGAIGEHLGFSEWHVVTQQQVDGFADATGDHQWIHVDVERARSGPFGGTIAHGYLTLSMIPQLGREVFRVDGIAMGINYGCNKVRFPAPLPVGARVRAGVEVADVQELRQGTQVGYRYTIELEGAPRPVCVAETVVLLVG